MKKRVLLQCQSLTYFYNGLGAVYTKYPGENIDIDVLFTNNSFIAKSFIEKIKASKYVQNAYIYDYQTFSKISKKIKKNKKNKFNTYLFNRFYKPKIFKTLRKQFNNYEYTDIVYSHETQSNIISYLKFAYPGAHFIMTGDGAGLLMGSNSRLVDPLMKNPFEYKFFDEMKPDEIIALAPVLEDDSFDVSNIPISAINVQILLKIIFEDEKIQNEINTFTEDILEKYRHCKNKVLILTTLLSDIRLNMSKDSQVQIYADMIDKYCPDNGLVILKLHPTAREDFIYSVKEKCKKNCELVFIPSYLKEYPVEIYYNLIQNLDFVITFLSSSCISLARLYNIKTVDAYEITQKYPLKDKVNSSFKINNEIINLLKDWDEKSLLYKCDLASELVKLYSEEKIPDDKKERKKLSLLQKIFSVTNCYSDYGKKKQIVIFGIKIKI